MTGPQEQFAEVVRRSQAAAADVVQAWATLTKSPTVAAAAAPTSTWDSAALIDQAFDFAARMLADQRDLTKKLIELSGQLAETAQAETASAVSSTSKRAKTARDAANRRTEATIGAARERGEEARRAAMDATDAMLQTARQGAETMLEAAKQHMPAVPIPAAKPSAAPVVSARAAGRGRAPADSPAAAPVEEAAPKRRRTAAAKASTTASKAASKAPAKSGPTRSARASKPGPKPAKVIPPDYASMSKVELQALLVARGQPKSGNVPELRDRLRAHDAS